MGEIFHALEVLNRTMKLGLQPPDLLRAEMGFKSALALRGNPDPTIAGDPVALAERYELVAELRPRAEALSLGQLSTLAKREMTRPRTKVDARTLKQITKALDATVPEKVAVTATVREKVAVTPVQKAPAAKVAAKAAPVKAGAKKAGAKKAGAKKPS
jgi:hypothetical protein